MEPLNPPAAHAPTPASLFKTDAVRVSGDVRHRTFIRNALRGYGRSRDDKKGRYQDWEGARTAAAEVKREAIDGLDRHLTEFADRLSARGAEVFWATDGPSACGYVLALAEARGAKRIIKSKTMVSEEIHLNEALEARGYEVVESDLGEYIMQLRQQPPYHIVFPAMHLTRGEISDLFQKELGTEATEAPEELTAIARRILREKYGEADIGISGANFAIAETGMISITENEGNARLTTSLPRIHIALVGIEKVLPRLADLALFLPVLATAGTGQALTCYNTMLAGPRREDEPDGPEEFHVVLVDNRRTELLADGEQRDALHCIRCGACLNVCPIFNNVGGHTYGTTYQGPIGAVITPHLRGLKPWAHLPAASTLCGACTEACPVKIDLHHHLLQLRRNAARGTAAPVEALAFRFFALLCRVPVLLELGRRLARLLQPLHRLIQGSRLDPMRPWTGTRDLPTVPAKSFRDRWREFPGRSTP